jgi:hypothetical protein
MMNRIYTFFFAVVLVNIFCHPNYVAAKADYGYGCPEGDLPNELRRDCHPEPNADEAKCRERGCVWSVQYK